MTHVIGAPVWIARDNRIVMFLRFGLFAASLLAAGAATGWLIARAVAPAAEVYVSLALVIALLVAHELRGRRVPIPQLRAQVPAVLRERDFVAPLVYGLMLGTGVLTRIPSVLFYFYFLALLLVASPVQGVLAGASFAASYATGVLLLGEQTSCDDPGVQADKVARFVARTRTASAATALAAAALVALLALG